LNKFQQDQLKTIPAISDLVESSFKTFFEAIVLQKKNKSY